MPRKKPDTTPGGGTGQENKPNPVAVLVAEIIRSYGAVAQAQKANAGEFKTHAENVLRSVIIGPTLSIALAWVEREREFAEQFARILVERDRAIQGVLDDANTPTEGGDV